MVLLKIEDLRVLKLLDGSQGYGRRGIKLYCNPKLIVG